MHNQKYVLAVFNNLVHYGCTVFGIETFLCVFITYFGNAFVSMVENSTIGFSVGGILLPDILNLYVPICLIFIYRWFVINGTLLLYYQHQRLIKIVIF